MIKCDSCFMEYQAEVMNPTVLIDNDLKIMFLCPVCYDRVVSIYAGAITRLPITRELIKYIKENYK